MVASRFRRKPKQLERAHPLRAYERKARVKKFAYIQS